MISANNPQVKMLSLSEEVHSLDGELYRRLLFVVFVWLPSSPVSERTLASLIGSLNHSNRFPSFQNRALSQFSDASLAKGAGVIFLVPFALTSPI